MPHPPIRLLQIASTSQMGGAEQIMLNVVRYADPGRLFPSVLALMDSGPLPRLAAAAGAFSNSWSLKSIGDPRLFRRMQLFLREGNYDLVQCYGLRAEVLARWVARGLGVKVISSICSVDPWRKPHHVFLDRLTADGVTAWLSTSEAAKETRVRREGFPAHRIAVIPTGIPDRPAADAARRAAARKRLQIPEDAGPVLAVVANLRPAKGHLDLIDALAELKPRFPNLLCLCAGRDDSGGAISRAAEMKGLSETIRFLGFRADAPIVYEAADLAVLPSHWEGMPLALIEALRAGIASVATDVGGNREVLRHEHEGLLCAANNPAQLAAAIARALGDDAARARWARAARTRYEESFRVETMVERMTGFFESVTRPPPPASELADGR